jgi:hypothetical protein
MRAHSINHGRALLYQHRHPWWFKYMEPVISFIGVLLMLAGLFVLEGISLGAGFVAVAWVALKVFG